MSANRRFRDKSVILEPGLHRKMLILKDMLNGKCIAQGVLPALKSAGK
jgi:hypothetical protein